jgi:hypothetical protein
MRTIRPAICALAMAGVMPAAAQQPTAFESAGLKTMEFCLSSQANDISSAKIAESSCRQAITDLAALHRATSGMSAHDQNVYLALHSMATTRIGHAWSKLDGDVRTSRVCMQMEAAWTAVSQLVPNASPALAETIKTLRDSSINVVRQCRSDYGTPANSTLLP